MRGSLYRSRIVVDDETEIRTWAARLHVSPQTLRAVVDRVGNWSDDVQFALNDYGNGLIEARHATADPGGRAGDYSALPAGT